MSILKKALSFVAKTAAENLVTSFTTEVGNKIGEAVGKRFASKISPDEVEKKDEDKKDQSSSPPDKISIQAS